MTITLRAGVLNSGIQQNGTEFLTVDTSNNATLSNNLTVTGASAFTGQVTTTNGAAVGGNLQFNSGYGSSATAYGCRAWVNFNGTGTVAIRASGNVSSITDNGTGDYTVNFTTALVDANYAGVSGLTNDGSTATANPRVAEMVNTSSSAMRMLCMDSGSGVAGDMNSVYVSIFR